MFGIDVSEHQGLIQWDLVKPQIDFAILRLGWIGKSGSHQLDTQFEKNYQECKRLGIPIGLYVYCYSHTPENAANGAEWALEALKGRTLELPVYIDMEDPNIVGLGQNTLTQICISFNSIIEKDGYWAGVYADKDWYTHHLNTPELKKRYTTWIAAYSSGSDRFKGEFDMWQNSSSGQINGISTRVDTDYMYRDLLDEINHSRTPK